MRRALVVRIATPLACCAVIAACSVRAPSGGRGAGAAAASSVTAQAQTDAGWPAHGGDRGGRRYAPLTQITAANVHALRVAWIFRTGELGKGVRDWKRSAFEATPILYDGTLYFTTPTTNVLAINAATGALRWRHDSHNRNDLHYSDGVSRGVSLWVDPSTAPGTACHARIFAPTLDSRLLALDAATGQACQDFGDHGAVDLLRGIRSVDK